MIAHPINAVRVLDALLEQRAEAPRRSLALGLGGRPTVPPLVQHKISQERRRQARAAHLC